MIELMSWSSTPGRYVRADRHARLLLRVPNSGRYRKPRRRVKVPDDGETSRAALIFRCRNAPARQRSFQYQPRLDPDSLGAAIAAWTKDSQFQIDDLADVGLAMIGVSGL